MHTTLISADDLMRAIANTVHVKIIDCRASLSDPAYGLRSYLDGHLPGAVHASLETDLAGAAGAGGRHPLPDPEALADRFRAWGVDDDDQLVMYDDAGGAFAARAWWCARWLGHAAAAVLDGGFAEWVGPLETGLATAPRTGAAAGNFSIRPSLTRTIDVATLQARLGAILLVDARAQARFDGLEEPIDPVAGHIPGAVCRPFQGNLDQSQHFLPPATLRERFLQGRSAEPPTDVVCYCGSGVTAAHNVLAMRIAGLPEPALYAGSWSEWLLDPTRPRAP